MSKIYWSGRTTNGLSKWKSEANTMHELYQNLVAKDIISISDEDPYENFVLGKYDKTIYDSEFLDADGDTDYDKVQDFIESHCISDKELWKLIEDCDGNAYYQIFERDNGDEREEICEDDFDENGKFKY